VACIEWIGERYRYKDRIGQTTRALGGTETAGYNIRMTEQVCMLLDQYKKSFPL